MHSSVLLGAVALLSTFVVAGEADKPKFYFPKQVKRQLTGKYIQAPAYQYSEANIRKEKRVSPFLDPAQLNGFVPAGEDLPSGAPVPSSTSSTADVVTVIVSATTVVDPSQAASTTPVSTDSDSSPAAASTTPANTDSDSSPAAASTTPVNTDSSSDSSSATDSGSAASVTPIIVLPSITLPSLLPGPTTIAPSGILSDTTTPDPAATTSSDSSIPTSASDDGITFTGSGTSASAAASTSDPALISIPLLSSIIATLVPTPTVLSGITGPGSAGSAPTTASDLLPPVISAPTATPVPVSETTTSTDALGSVTTITSVGSSVPTTTSIGNPVSSILSGLIPASSSSILSGITGPGTGTAVSGGTSTSITAGIFPTSSGTAGTTLSDTGASPTNSTLVVGPTATGVLTSATDSNATQPTSINSATAPTSILIPGTSANVTAPVISASSPAQTIIAPSSAVSVQPSVTTGVPATTAPAAASDPATQWIQPSIVYQPSPSGTTASATEVGSGIPTSWPAAIAPPAGIPSALPDSMLVQVGFTYQLNYEFVSQNAMSSAQIFHFLPIGTGNGLGVTAEQISMHSLVPWDTTASLGFITTLALFYIPVSLVDSLKLGLLAPQSSFYTNPDPSVAQLMGYINPSISIYPGAEVLGGSGTTGPAGAATSAAVPTPGSGVFTTDDQNTSSAIRTNTVGIAIGAVGGAAAYGAAMFFLARRYKKKKLSHRRSSSVMNPEMRYTGSPALMSGAMMSGARNSDPSSGLHNGRDSRGSGRTGNSARTAQISAPMMAENSLGWN